MRPLAVLKPLGGGQEGPPSPYRDMDGPTVFNNHDPQGQRSYDAIPLKGCVPLVFRVSVAQQSGVLGGGALPGSGHGSIELYTYVHHVIHNRY